MFFFLLLLLFLRFQLYLMLDIALSYNPEELSRKTNDANLKQWQNGPNLGQKQLGVYVY